METNPNFGQLKAVVKHVLQKHKDRVTGRVCFDDRLEFFSDHQGSDATYVSIMGWRKSSRDGGQLIYKAVMYWNRIEEEIGSVSDVTVEQCLRYMPAIERWLHVEDDEVEDDEDDDEPECGDIDA